MKIYNYNETTKEYIGESIADEDPLHKNNFLIPAYATIKPHLDHKEGSITLWNGENWEYIKDDRGDNIEIVKPYTAPISMRQCRLKLLKMNLLEVVEAEMQKDKALSIEWEYATEIKIDNPIVLMLSEKLGLDEGARIKMFAEARLL